MSVCRVRFDHGSTSDPHLHPDRGRRNHRIERLQQGFEERCRGSRRTPTVTKPMPPSAWRSRSGNPGEQILNVLRQIQNDLFDAGADLSTPVVEKPEHPPLRITQSYIDRLESWCDEFNEPLPALNSFVLPGGTPLSALLHVARTVARRAERSAWLRRGDPPGFGQRAARQVPQPAVGPAVHSVPGGQSRRRRVVAARRGPATG